MPQSPKVGEEVQLCSFFNLGARRGGEGFQGHAQVALHPAERHITSFTGPWVVSSAGLDGCGKSRSQQNS